VRWLFLFCLLIFPALADTQAGPSWNVAVPLTWEADKADPNDPTLVTRLYPKDRNRNCLVVIRRYPEKFNTSLKDEFNQLRYGVVLKLEGKVLSQQAWPVAGQPGLKVVYQGRSSTGAFKTFVRYMTIYRGDLLTMHCVASSKPPLDLVDFQAICEGITVSVPAPDAPEADEPH
jgi:hypothetical protein